MENQRKLELTLCGMLPYGLMVQYEGITNTKDFTEYNKKVKQYIGGDFFASEIDFEMPTEIIGSKIAPLKELHYYKKYFNAKAGIKNGGLKSFFNGTGLKPLLHTLPKLKYVFKEMTEDEKSIICNFEHLNQKTLWQEPFFVIEILIKYHFNIYDLPSDMYIEKSEVK